MAVGIYTSGKKNGEGVPISFFGQRDEQLLKTLYEEAIKIVGPGIEHYDPEPGMIVRKVGEVQLSTVNDDGVYRVEADEAAKPETGRVPPGANGTWAVQSLIFSKDNFNLAQATKWVKDHEGFGDYGHEETETSFRFRQFDPQYFSEYRTVTIDEGISSAYGKISKDVERGKKEATKALEASIAIWSAVRKINEGILAKGLKLLAGSARIYKGKDAGHEERFVMSLVLEPNDGKDGSPLKPDTQGDVYSKADVRYGCHYWMEHGGAVDLSHSWKALAKEQVHTLENFIAPCDFTLGKGDNAYDVVEGTWLLGLRIVDEQLWEGIKSGRIGAYSIGGTAFRDEETE